MLVLAAIIAFLVKAGRRDALPYVHAGWVSAIALGGITWLVATYAIGLSGANREITEGVTALLAAAMLIYVGFWLHNKAYAHAWNRFIKEQVGSALEKKTLWAMAGVSFLAVYREAVRNRALLPGAVDTGRSRQPARADWRYSRGCSAARRNRLGDLQ